MKSIPKKKTKDLSIVGMYGIANSAGIVGWYIGGAVFKSLRAAKNQAKIESAGGWLGECWAVQFVPDLL